MSAPVSFHADEFNIVGGQLTCSPCALLLQVPPGDWVVTIGEHYSVAPWRVAIRCTTTPHLSRSVRPLSALLSCDTRKYCTCLQRILQTCFVRFTPSITIRHWSTGRLAVWPRYEHVALFKGLVTQSCGVHNDDGIDVFASGCVLQRLAMNLV